MAARAVAEFLTIGEMIDGILGDPEVSRVWLYVGDGFTLLNTYSTDGSLSHSSISEPPERPHLTVSAIQRVVLRSYQQHTN